MSSNWNNQDSPSSNSYPFQHAYSAQSESSTQYQYLYSQDLHQDQNSGASYNSHGPTHNVNPAQRSGFYNMASSSGYPPNIAQAQSQPYSYTPNEPQRHERQDFAIDSRPDPHLDALRRAMMEAVTPSSSPPPMHEARNNRGTASFTSNSEPYQMTSSISQVVSFFKGLTPLKATLARKFPDARYGVIDKLNELGVKWSEPNGTGRMYCESGVRGTADYVAYVVRWVVNGAPGGKPAIPGGENWYTKVEIVKAEGSGSRFRELGKKTLDAAKYKARGAALIDYSITTWGLY